MDDMSQTVREDSTPYQDAGVSFSFESLPTMDDLQSRYVELLLARGGYSRARIAQTLGISERTVYRILSARQKAPASAS